MSDPFHHLRPRAAEDVLGSRLDGGEYCHTCNRVVHPDDLVEWEGEKICGWCLKESPNRPNYGDGRQPTKTMSEWKECPKCRCDDYY